VLLYDERPKPRKRDARRCGTSGRLQLHRPRVHMDMPSVPATSRSLQSMSPPFGLRSETMLLRMRWRDMSRGVLPSLRVTVHTPKSSGCGKWSSRNR
jgi:hypothetical protein